MNKEIRDFKEVLARWKAIYCKTGKLHLLAYVLQKPEESEHQTLEYEKLKETDKCKVQFLREHCGEAGFCIFLASMNCTVDENDENGEKDIYLAEAIDLDGHMNAGIVILEESDIIQTDAFEDRDSIYSDDYSYTSYRNIPYRDTPYSRYRDDDDDDDDERPKHYRDRVRGHYESQPLLRYISENF